MSTPMMRRMLAAMMSGGGGESDPYWSSVVLLAGNDNAANASTTFIDQSSSHKTITRVGTGATYSSTFAPAGMTTSLKNTAASPPLQLADSADWDLGSGDFTIEAMIYYTSNTYYGTIAGQYDPSSNKAWSVPFSRPTTDTNSYFSYTTNGSTATNLMVAWTPSQNTWYHIAVAKTGSTVKFFVGGTQVGTNKTLSGTIFNSTLTLSLMSDNTNGDSFVGYMSNIRITKGVARYTGTFTPPTLPMPTQ